MSALEPGFLDVKDTALTESLTTLVNEVYLVAEEGLWQPDTLRTDTEEMAGLIEAGEIAVATLDGEVVGAIRIQDLSDEMGEFGMLAGDPEHRRIGVGRELVAFAERHARDRGHRTMQLELLVPLGWRHPNKVFLDEWYTRIGYRVTRRMAVAETYPHLAPHLATKCEFAVYEKPL